MSKNLKVDTYIKSLPRWQMKICTKARKLIHDAEPGITEEIKFTNRPYFTYEGNVCALLQSKTHVNIFIYDPIASDPKNIINQGHNNKTARSIQIHEGTFPDEQAFKKLISAVVANNKKGGWRKIQATQTMYRTVRKPPLWRFSYFIWASSFTLNFTIFVISNFGSF